MYIPQFNPRVRKDQKSGLFFLKLEIMKVRLFHINQDLILNEKQRIRL